MILAWDNQIDQAIITASSEVSTLPGSNVQHAHVSRKWHTASGVKSAYIIIDCTMPLSFSLGALIGTNLTTSATVRWRASDTDPTVTSSLVLDTGVISAGIKAGYGATYGRWASVAARYRRVDISDLTLPDNLQIGRIFCGPHWEPSINMELPWSITPLDESLVEDSYGGQSYADARPQRRMLRFALTFLSEAEIFSNAFAMARASGIVRDVLAIPDISSSFISEQSVYGLHAASEPISEPRLGLFRQAFTIRERL